jgi:hypothetical protein
MMRYGFVVASPRSGTTFLMAALSGMRGFLTKVGEVYPLHLGHLYAHLPAAQRAVLQRALRFQLEECAARCGSSRLDTLVDCLRGRVGVGELVGSLRRRRKVEGLIFKEPFLAFAPELMMAAVPEARLVFLHRDGRDSADSLVRSYGTLSDAALGSQVPAEIVMGRRHGARWVPWWVEEGADDAFLAASAFVRNVWLWKAMNARCIRCFAGDDAVASGRVLRVSYESLVDDPARVGRLIVKHLGGEWTRRLERRFGMASSRSVGIHKLRPAAEVEGATALAQDELAALGYLASR